MPFPLLINFANVLFGPQTQKTQKYNKISVIESKGKIKLIKSKSRTKTLDSLLSRISRNTTRFLSKGSAKFYEFTPIIIDIGRYDFLFKYHSRIDNALKSKKNYTSL